MSWRFGYIDVESQAPVRLLSFPQEEQEVHLLALVVRGNAGFGERMRERLLYPAKRAIRNDRRGVKALRLFYFGFQAISSKVGTIKYISQDGKGIQFILLTINFNFLEANSSGFL